MACELADGRRPLPGGRIFETDYWLVEHCVGRLGLGTLIVKPERHVTSVADLSDGEAAELGPLLRRASAVAEQLVSTEQTYNCLWSHAGGVRVHIHYVVQPVTAEQMASSRRTDQTCRLPWSLAVGHPRNRRSSVLPTRLARHSCPTERDHAPRSAGLRC